MELNRIVKFGSTLNGPDKVIKFLQGLAKFFGYFAAKNGNKENHGEWNRLASAFSDARKGFRCNKDVENFSKLLTILGSKTLSPIDRLIQLFTVTMTEIFIFFDHLLFAAKVKFRTHDTQRWLQISCFGWFWSCIGNCVVALRKIHSIDEQLSAAQGEGVKVLRAQRFEEVLNVVCNAADAACAGSIIGYDAKLGLRVNDGQYGIFSMLAAAIAARSVYRSCR